MTAAAHLDGWASDAIAAEYANQLSLAFLDAGWVVQVSAVDQTGNRSFRAHRDGVTVVSDKAGIRVTRDGDVVREFPSGTPVEDVLAAATDANTSTED